jgi:hypothetical protein
MTMAPHQKILKAADLLEERGGMICQPMNQYRSSRSRYAEDESANGARTHPETLKAHKAKEQQGSADRPPYGIHQVELRQNVYVPSDARSVGYRPRLVRQL